MRFFYIILADEAHDLVLIVSIFFLSAYFADFLNLDIGHSLFDIGYSVFLYFLPTYQLSGVILVFVVNLI